MKNLVAGIFAVFCMFAFHSTVYAGAPVALPEYKMVLTAESIPDPQIPLWKLSPLAEEYSWLFFPGMIALAVVVVLVINIIMLKRKH